MSRNNNNSSKPVPKRTMATRESTRFITDVASADNVERGVDMDNHDDLTRSFVRWGVAFHEAGHFVMALHVGMRVVRVEIYDATFGGGLTTAMGGRYWTDLLLYRLGGPVADLLQWASDDERHSMPLPRDKSNESDHVKAWEAALTTGLPGDEVGARFVLENCDRVARRVLWNRWHEVEAVAAALHRRGKLTGSQAASIARDARKKNVQMLEAMTIRCLIEPRR